MAKSGIHRQLGSLVGYVIKNKYEKLPKKQRPYFGVTKLEIIDSIRELFEDNYRTELMRYDLNYNYNEIEKLHEIVSNEKLLSYLVIRTLQKYDRKGLHQIAIIYSNEIIYGLRSTIAKKLERGEFIGNREMNHPFAK